MRLLKYMGGKTFLLPKLLPLPQHKTYFEVFGGSGAVLLNKIPAKFEYHNDINDFLVNFYYQIKNNCDALISSLEYELISRSTFVKYRDAMKNPITSDLEKAKYFYYLNATCFGGKMGSGLSHRGISFERNDASSYFNKLLDFKKVHERIKYVQFLNLDYHIVFKKLLDQFNRDDVLIYLDPPYGADSKYGTGFTNEEDMVNVIEYCNQLDKAQIILSYDQPIVDWKFKKYKKITSLDNKHPKIQNEYIFYKNCKKQTQNESEDITSFL